MLERPGGGGVSRKVLGAREFSQLYKQRFGHLASSAGASKQMQLTYHGFGLPAVAKEEVVRRNAQRTHARRRDWQNLKSQMANDKIYKLPKNVPY